MILQASSAHPSGDGEIKIVTCQSWYTIKIIHVICMYVCVYVGCGINRNVCYWFLQAAYNFIKQQDWPFWTNCVSRSSATNLSPYFFDFYEDFNDTLHPIYKIIIGRIWIVWEVNLSWDTVYETANEYEYDVGSWTSLVH